MIQGIATICVGFGETSTRLAARTYASSPEVENEDLIGLAIPKVWIWQFWTVIEIMSDSGTIVDLAQVSIGTM